MFNVPLDSNGIMNQTMKPWTMRVMAITALLLSTLGLSAASAGPPEFERLEPTVKRHVGVLPGSVCRELIALGEEIGFATDQKYESIDNNAENYTVISQQINVLDRDAGIVSPAIWKALEPWIPELTELAKKSIDKTMDSIYFPDNPDRVPQLDWVFFRKYSPDAKRNSLALHTDSNMHTLNIALNDDFEGGGLFYVKPPERQPPQSNADRPNIYGRYKNYEFINNLKRQNTSDFVFPALQTGDVLIHNYSLWHAVAPIEAGTRYSFILFYDMDNPAIQNDFDDIPKEFPVAFYHEFDDIYIDLAFVEPRDKHLIVMEKGIAPFQEFILNTYDGHLFRALISGTDTVVSEFVMRDHQYLYKIANDEL
mmetsp:Transcript_20349/g.44215  ORF Transcript_20349/g.44215 Transcript_20349/m.44215 type:complete len:367 (-) Transcript_20349:164-1264(-)